MEDSHVSHALLDPGDPHWWHADPGSCLSDTFLAIGLRLESMNRKRFMETCCVVDPDPIGTEIINFGSGSDKLLSSMTKIS